MGDEVWKGRDESIVIDEDEPLCFRGSALVEVLNKGEVGFCEGKIGGGDCEIDVDWLILDEGFDVG